MTSELEQYVKEWLGKAANDLSAAQRLIDIEPMILDIACFHCQQCIEKSLKAYLVCKGKDVVRTHDIDFLLNECSQFDPIFDAIDTLNINDFAVRIRYPDSGLLPEPQEAKEYFQIATNVNLLVNERIVFPVK